VPSAADIARAQAAREKAGNVSIDEATMRDVAKLEATTGLPGPHDKLSYSYWGPKRGSAAEVIQKKHEAKEHASVATFPNSPGILDALSGGNWTTIVDGKEVQQDNPYYPHRLIPLAMLKQEGMLTRPVHGYWHFRNRSMPCSKVLVQTLPEWACRLTPLELEASAGDLPPEVAIAFGFISPPVAPPATPTISEEERVQLGLQHTEDLTDLPKTEDTSTTPETQDVDLPDDWVSEEETQEEKGAKGPGEDRAMKMMVKHRLKSFKAGLKPSSKGNYKPLSGVWTDVIGRFWDRQLMELPAKSSFDLGLLPSGLYIIPESILEAFRKDLEIPTAHRRELGRMWSADAFARLSGHYEPSDFLIFVEFMPQDNPAFIRAALIKEAWGHFQALQICTNAAAVHMKLGSRADAVLPLVEDLARNSSIAPTGTALYSELAKATKDLGQAFTSGSREYQLSFAKVLEGIDRVEERTTTALAEQTVGTGEQLMSLARSMDGLAKALEGAQKRTVPAYPSFDYGAYEKTLSERSEWSGTHRSIGRRPDPRFMRTNTPPAPIKSGSQDEDNWDEDGTGADWDYAKFTDYHESKVDKEEHIIKSPPPAPGAVKRRDLARFKPKK